MATDQEISLGRAINWTLRAKDAPLHIREAWIGTSWIVEVAATATSDGKPFHATHLFMTSLRTIPDTWLQLVLERWSIENEWLWSRDAQLGEDAHRYANCTAAQLFPFLRTIVMNLLCRAATARFAWDC